MPEHSHNAFRGLYDMFAEMGRMREHLTQSDRPSEGRASSGSAWIPAVDIYAQGDDLVIRCELAGVARKDMEVALCRGQLWISGERAGAPEGADVTDYVRERRYGPFRRTINLPPRVERDQLRATLELGLLEVVVEGGASPAQDERIEIEAADRDEVSIDVGTNASVRPPE
jgi:HSP20 family protein